MAVVPWHSNANVHGQKLSRASDHCQFHLPIGAAILSASNIVTQMVHFAYHAEAVAGGWVMASRSKRKEFRTSVILTEVQFKQVREIAQANDV